MADSLSLPLRQALAQGVLEPQLILEIEGVPTIYGAKLIQKRIQIGDTGLVIGDAWVIGGLNDVLDQSDLISLDGGTTTSIRQTLNQDKGIGSSISSMQICLVDINQEATQLVSPGIVVEDLLGRKAKVYYGVTGDTAFPEDFLIIFRGLIDDIQSRQGNVLLNISHPDQKKRQEIFYPNEFTLSAAATAADDNSIQVNEPANMIMGAGEMTVLLKIDNEYASVTSFDPTLNALGTDRAQLSSVAATHASAATAKMVYRLQGNIIDIALKLMLSGRDSLGNYIYYSENLVPSSINYINPETTIQNALYFNGIDLVQKYGVTVGDFLYLSGSAVAGNNNIGKWTIDQINTTDYLGTVLVISIGTANQLVTETSTTGSIDLLSQYNIYPIGLKMTPDEVDVAEHLRLKRLFLSGFSIDITLTDAENGREFIEQELYAVAGCYSLPRKARSSIGILSAPIPGTEIKTLSANNITNAKSLAVRRTIANNFYNEIVYKYDWSLADNQPNRGIVIRDETSINRIKSGKKTLVIESRGLRQTLNGGNLAQAAAQRRLNRYKLAAEEIEQVKVLFSVGFNIEIGDIVILDGSDGVLNLINSSLGNRSPAPRLYEVTNKTVNIKTGEVILKLVDTSYDTSARYGLISPASYIKTGLSQTQFIIEESFSSIHGANEYLKWVPWVTSEAKAVVRVRNSDFSINASSVISSISGNKITLETALGFTPAAGQIMELALYSNVNTTANSKLVFAYFATGAGVANFADGKAPYQYL